MRRWVCHLFLLLLPLLSVGDVRAATVLPPVVVVEFGAHAMGSGSRLGDALALAQKEHAGVVRLLMPNMAALQTWLESHAEQPMTMVVLLRPQAGEALHALPGQYPDVRFTLIDPTDPVYAPNVQNVQFKERDGVFLLGAIAAIRSTGPLMVLGLDDDARSRGLVEQFTAGARHIRAGMVVQSRLGLATTEARQLESMIGGLFQQGAALVFALDPSLTDMALAAAKQERKLVMSMDVSSDHAEAGRLLTYLVKRYDLALLDMLHVLDQKQWHSGTITLGVNGGYVDYSLTTDNVELFPKEAIDRIEALKDYAGQGLYDAPVH